MILVSKYKPHRVLELIREQMDESPSFLRNIVTLGANNFSGTADVCGTVSESEFELRNRNGPQFSLRAKGRLYELDTGTKIVIDFSKPSFPSIDIFGVIFFNRYKYDQEKIVNFLKEYLKVKEII